MHAASAHLRTCIIASRLDDLRRVVPLAKGDVEYLHRVCAALYWWAAWQGRLESNLVARSAEAHLRGAALGLFHFDEVKPDNSSCIVLN